MLVKDVNNKAKKFVKPVCPICGKERTLSTKTFNAFSIKYRKYGMPESESVKCNKCRHSSFLVLRCNHCNGNHLMSLVHFVYVEKAGPKEYPICKKCGERISVLSIVKAGLRQPSAGESVRVGNCLIASSTNGTRCEKNITCPNYTECLQLAVSKQWVGWTAIADNEGTL